MSPVDLSNALEKAFPVGDSWDDYGESGGRYGLSGYGGSYWGEKGEGANAFYHRLAESDASIEVEGLGTFTKVVYETSHNESGDIDATLVFKFIPTLDGPVLFEAPNEKIYRITGSLDSWSGGPWDGSLVEVKPVEKTVIVWERKVNYV